MLTIAVDLKRGRTRLIQIGGNQGEPRHALANTSLSKRRLMPQAHGVLLGFSGAEIEQAVVSALYGLVAEGTPRLTDERLRMEIQRIVPLSQSCREEVAALRRMARERFVLAE